MSQQNYTNSKHFIVKFEDYTTPISKEATGKILERVPSSIFM
jgi:hypothetical protein